ncbi:uncharacterized protein METZ01_LOCUS230921, partial [marine metagenome]
VGADGSDKRHAGSVSMEPNPVTAGA